MALRTKGAQSEYPERGDVGFGRTNRRGAGWVCVVVLEAVEETVGDDGGNTLGCDSSGTLAGMELDVDADAEDDDEDDDLHMLVIASIKDKTCSIGGRCGTTLQ